MGSLVLTVGTGSTWAMRTALVLAMSGLKWQEQVFDLEDAKELQRLKRTAPAGLVPWLDDGELRIHDSLAIAEYLHECCPERHLYPVDKAERALARSLCAELHAGFRQIRTLLPFFLGAPTQSEPPVEVIDELARLQTLWSLSLIHICTWWRRISPPARRCCPSGWKRRSLCRTGLGSSGSGERMAKGCGHRGGTSRSRCVFRSPPASC